MAVGLEHHPHVRGDSDLAAEAHAIVRMGKALLSAGASTYRVRRCMERVAAAVGIEWLQSQVTLSELTVTLFKGSQFRTQVGQVHSISVNADKLTRLEELAATIGTTPTRTKWGERTKWPEPSPATPACPADAGPADASPDDSEQVDDLIDPAAIESAIDAIDHRRRLYPVWLNALAAAIACAAVAFLNQASPLIIAGVLVAAFLGQLVRVVMTRCHLNAYLTALVSASVAAFAYVGLASLLECLTGTSSDLGAGYVPAVLFLLPGFPLVNAALDLVKSDMTAGLSRLAYASMVLLSATAALIAVTWAAGVRPDPLPAPVIDPVLWWVLAGLTSWIGVAGWSVLFNSPWRTALTAGLVGMVANLARLGLEDFLPGWLAAAIACLMIGLLARVVAVRNHIANATIAVPAALVMLPGSSAYRALVAFAEGDAVVLLANTSTALFTIGGMAIGLSLARILTDRDWAQDKRQAMGSAQ